ncbi:MAG: hypothetical protein ACI4SH_03515, partial [Candidatus Scatosoma sp.]
MNNGGVNGTDERGGGAKCVISLLTEADGKKTLTVRRGAMSMINGGVSVSYEGEGDKGVFFTDGNRAEWSGEGEMRSALCFEKDKITRG